MSGGSACRWRVLCRRWRAWWCACAVLCALLMCARPAARSLRHDQLFPDITPDKIAHALADFSNQPHVVSWVVEQDRSNYTTWWYSVRYECGTRCVGRARVTAHAEHAGAPRHGHAAATHTLTVARTQCRTLLPLLPWPSFCEEIEWSAWVQGEAGGARLRGVLTSRCGALACSADLAEYLQMILAPLPHPQTHYSVLLTPHN